MKAMILLKDEGQRSNFSELLKFNANEPHPHCMGEPTYCVSKDMANQEGQGDSERRSSQKASFMGRGRAVLTILDFNHWKNFFKRDGRDLTMEEKVDIEYAASFDNYSVDGKVRVDWPEVTVEFNMDRFLGEF